MNVTYVIPYGPNGDPCRERNYERVRAHLATMGDPVKTIELPTGDGYAQRIARARNNAVAPLLADLGHVFVFNDADSLVDGFQLIRACSLARQEPGLVLAYTRYRRLTPESTASILADGWKTEHVESEQDLPNSLSSGCVAISVASFREVGGYDDTWQDGFEDYDFALRCNALWPLRRVNGDLLHLWHERPAVEPENGRDRARYQALYT